MTKNTNKRKAIKLPLPSPSPESTLPFNGEYVKDGQFTFSFSCFNRQHELFNLGGKAEDKTVGGKWFLDLLDCLKSVSGKTIQELQNSTHDLHRVNWKNTNTKCPDDSLQKEYWQFRIDKSHGRVIGILIDAVFYVVWLDPHHHLTDSEGYGGINKYKYPTSEYEDLLQKISNLEKENLKLNEDINELLNR